MPPAGFEDRDDHRTACASILLTDYLKAELQREEAKQQRTGLKAKAAGAGR